MLKSNDLFKNKTYLVYGYGKTGSATYKYLNTDEVIEKALSLFSEIKKNYI